MRYAIVSDLHANAQAWNTVLVDIRAAGIRQVICLGDIVGYGPNPAEVLESVHKNVNHLVLGNHDAVICGKMDASLFHDAARDIILWTRDLLNAEAVDFLRSLPLSLQADTFRCTHGEFSTPAAFNYIIEPDDALPSWQAVDDQLLFIGHTHQPAIFLLGASGTPRTVAPQNFVLEPGKRFIVNVGSVGQPRDGDARACYCVLDTAEQTVRWRRVPFDLDAYRNALDVAGLPAEPSYFLSHDPRLGVPPLRPLLNFSPAATAHDAVKDTVEVQELADVKHRLTKWRLLFAMMCVLLLVAGAATVLALWSHHTRARDITGHTTKSLTACNIPRDTNILAVPDTRIPTGAPVPGWTLHLGDKRKQDIRVDHWHDPRAPTTSDPTIVFVMSSRTDKDDIALYSTPITVEQGMKLCFEVMFKKNDAFNGTIAAGVSLLKRTALGVETTEHFAVKEPNQIRKGGWLLAKSTFNVPADAASIRFKVYGRFTGTAVIRDLILVRKD